MHSPEEKMVEGNLHLKRSTICGITMRGVWQLLCGSNGRYHLCSHSTLIWSLYIFAIRTHKPSYHIYLYIGIGGQPADISFIFKEETKDDLLTSSLFIKSHTDISQDKRTLSLKWILDMVVY